MLALGLFMTRAFVNIVFKCLYFLLPVVYREQ